MLLLMCLPSSSLVSELSQYKSPQPALTGHGNFFQGEIKKRLKRVEIVGNIIFVVGNLFYFYFSPDVF